MDYIQAEKFLRSLEDYEKSPGIVYNAANYDLRRMELLLDALGNPHKGRKTIHVAGTKGKGSTAAMISSVLSSAGYRTGLFTSPHLFSWQERIAVDGRPISQGNFARLMTLIAPLVNAINREMRFGRLTTFEIVTALAFLYFHEKNIDFQVLETGMGGRLDATNVVDPDICIITSISFDHTQVLGNTLAQIAREKAGIIKPGCTVITAPQKSEVMRIIEDVCHQANVDLIRAGSDITWEPSGCDLKGQKFRVRSGLRDYMLHIPLLGDFQMENSAMALAALEVLQQQGLELNCTDIVRGFGRVKWPARMQVLWTSPLLMVDGAHNSYSIRNVVESIKKHFPYRKAVVIFGCSADKDIRGMAEALKGFADHVIVTRSGHPRSADTDVLLQAFGRVGLEAETLVNPELALHKALSIAGRKDIILATGSLFLAGDILTAFKKERNFGIHHPGSGDRSRKQQI